MIAELMRQMNIFVGYLIAIWLVGAFVLSLVGPRSSPSGISEAQVDAARTYRRFVLHWIIDGLFVLVFLYAMI